MLELGAGNAMVGMDVEKSVGNSRCCKGCVASYDSTLQSYQVKIAAPLKALTNMIM